jgi:hypothetical protein
VFTPELTDEEAGTFTLMANHAIADPKACQLSIEYNLARIRFGKTQLPAQISKCILVYDLRGQRVEPAVVASLKTAFAHIHELRIWQ